MEINEDEEAHKKMMQQIKEKAKNVSFLKKDHDMKPEKKPISSEDK